MVPLIVSQFIHANKCVSSFLICVGRVSETSFNNNTTSRVGLWGSKELVNNMKTREKVIEQKTEDSIGREFQ